MLDTCEWLAGQGVDLTVLPVEPDGRLDLDLLARELDKRVLLVAVMQVNNEIGVTQPISEIAEMAHDAGALMLCDAVQALGRVEICKGPDLVAVSAHKIHGPKGIGALWMRKGAEPAPFIHGGGQERGLRSGTLSPALCVGFGAAAKLADERDDPRLRPCPEAVECGASMRSDRAGRSTAAPTHRYHGNLNIRREGLDAARLIADLRDIAFSLGSACASGSGRPSHVLRALGLDYREARSSIRLGFGRYTTQKELVDACQPDRGARARAGEARRVTLVRFFRADGTLDKEVEAAPGQRLLDVAWAAREPLEGACEGVMACSTCHVIVDADDFEKLPPASEEEEDLLDLAAHATRTSRLACQIILTDEMESADRPRSRRAQGTGWGARRTDRRCGIDVATLVG